MMVSSGGPGGPGGKSYASVLAALSEAERQDLLAKLSDQERAALLYDWDFWARPSQRIPVGTWRIWLLLCGRGFGKTRVGAEAVRRRIETGQWKRVAIVNDTAADVRDVMIEGPAGLLAVCPPWSRPVYEPSKRRVTWPSGAVAIGYAAEAPELLRGPEHDGAWADEPPKWKNLWKQDVSGGTAWTNLMMGLRVGENPQCIATTTPRAGNAVKFLKELMARPTTHITRGSSYENRDNLSEDWFREIIAPYEGTRLGRQEISGDLLEDTPGALWTLDQIEALRLGQAPELARIVVAVDPAVSSHEDSNENGIVVAGRSLDGAGYVLADLSLVSSPDRWARRAVGAYHEYGADRIVYEDNQGGEMVAQTIRTVDSKVPLRAVHASRGKRTRAEPVAALYEQGRVHHVGMFPALEDQLTSWTPDSPDSPDRLDALVWALTELMLVGRPATIIPPEAVGKREGWHMGGA